ncbi:MAG: hypothetical protein QG552_183 [Thermodesulfobacteriota bacterium]|nr:hypothetical protein [Thermodesulfobacteriota bacterium]
MPLQIDTEAMNARILAIKKNAMELYRMADDFPAVARNSARILASARMLELNLSDLEDLEGNDS